LSVIVVGGGLAGLLTATELISAGMDDVLLVEKSDVPGGVARTIRRDGFTFEPAVGAVALPHAHLSPILGRIGVEMEPAAPTASVRQVYTNGRLISIPLSPKALLAPVIPWPAKVRALAEVLSPSRDLADESLANFCRRRFGRRAGDMVGWLMASGVYAGDPERLSARAAFPILRHLENDAGSVLRGALARRRHRQPSGARPGLHYPRDGMTDLAQRAAGFLGDGYRSGFEVESVRRDGSDWLVVGPETLRADSVILATGPHRTADLVDAELAEHLRELKTARVVVVGLGGEGEHTLPKGFGALVGPGEGMLSRGLLYESSYAPDRAPEGAWLLKVIAGGSGVRPWGDDIADVVRGEAETVIGRRLSPAVTIVVDDLPGIPQYEIGHLRWLDELEGLMAARSGLHVTGWGYRGVGVTQLATDALRVRNAVSGPNPRARQRPSQ